MKLTDKTKVNGKVTLELINPETKEVDKKITSTNLITSEGKYLLADLTRNRTNVVFTGAAYASAYLAAGTDSTAAAAADTVLGTESQRITTDSATRDNSSTTLKIITHAATTELNVSGLWELGLFGTGYDASGTLQTATASADSGICVTHAILSDSVTPTSSQLKKVTWNVVFS